MPEPPCGAVSVPLDSVDFVVVVASGSDEEAVVVVSSGVEEDAVVVVSASELEEVSASEDAALEELELVVPAVDELSSEQPVIIAQVITRAAISASAFFIVVTPFQIFDSYSLTLHH